MQLGWLLLLYYPVTESLGYFLREATLASSFSTIGAGRYLDANGSCAAVTLDPRISFRQDQSDAR